MTPPDLLPQLLPQSLLAYKPFVDSVQAIWPNLHAYWLFLAVPLVVGISVVYKTTKVRNLKALPRQAALMSLQILVAMILTAIGLFFLHYYWIRIV